MSQRIDTISNQDFQLVESSIKKSTEIFGEIYNFTEKSLGFEFLVLEKVFNLQEDEIIESITDTFFQQKIGNDADPDRGIDSIVIDEEKKEVHLFNFKYHDGGTDFEKIKSSEFDRTEVDKVLAFITDVFEKNKDVFLGNKANLLLREKVNEIWKLQDNGSVFNFKIHLVSNLFKGLTLSEHERFNLAISSRKNEVSFDYILVKEVVDKILQRTEKIDSNFRALNTNFFEKVDSGKKALIIEISAIDILRIVSNNKDVRVNSDSSNLDIFNSEINEKAFSDNVRLYLKEKTNVNSNIIETALDEEERGKIFFYNNGITITCEKISYQGSRNQIISLFDLQIVNGGQTIHALRTAFEKGQVGFEKITLLCKIFETNDSNFKNKIAEYTNSQNPVTDRDIRSIDSIQVKLEEDFKLLGYWYARKKFQHEEVEKNKRIDSEKLGQALIAFNIEMPAEAKNKKSLIFGEKYSLIFNDKLLAKNALEVLNLYREIEIRKLKNKSTKSYLLHSSYYILFFIKKIAIKNKKQNDYIYYYNEALEKIELIIQKEKDRLKEEYSDAVLFKSNRPKEYLTEVGL